MGIVTNMKAYVLLIETIQIITQFRHKAQGHSIVQLCKNKTWNSVSVVAYAYNLRACEAEADPEAETEKADTEALLWFWCSTS